MNVKYAEKLTADVEFQEIIETYILPLVGVYTDYTLIYAEEKNHALVSCDENINGNFEVKFYPCFTTAHPAQKFNKSLYHCQITTYSRIDVKGMRRILRELLKVATFKCVKGDIRKQRDYIETHYKKRSLDLAFELGMCAYLATKHTLLFSILCKMLEWTGKTYEGANVPFGIIVDFDSPSKSESKPDSESIDYLKFLENDHSSVFADGIFTGILLDKNAMFISYLTKDSSTYGKDTPERDIFIPYKYKDIARHCTGNKVGIIVNNNGEILLIKNQALCFAKRRSKWVFFDWNKVLYKLRPYFAKSDVKDDDITNNIRRIYCTLLDVSFSYTGGCLALALPEKIDDQTLFHEKDRLDDRVNVTCTLDEKTQALKCLLSGNNQKIQSFFHTPDVLRKEILSLDGATVISMQDGTFHCAGSIVQVASGSSGGGRTAAANALAKLGVAIKISEDGYIDAFGVSLEESSNMDKVVELFSLK